MNCISPPELEDRQLLAYLDGDADQQTKSHLEHCEYCREKAKALGQFQDHLSSRLYRITCPSSLELGEYHLHMLPPSQMLLVAQHLRECPHCTREIGELTDFLSDSVPTLGEGLLGNVRVLIAQLVGAGTQPGSTHTFPVLRGEAKGPMLFEADGIVITLDIQSGPNRQVSILGQVAADDQDNWLDGVAKLQQTNLSDLTVTLDDLGAFRFDVAHPGSIKLTVTSPHNIEVQIPNIDINI
jgi:hypothetical protein